MVPPAATVSLCSIWNGCSSIALERVPFHERIRIDRAHKGCSGAPKRRVQGVRFAAEFHDDHEIRVQTRAIRWCRTGRVPIAGLTTARTATSSNWAGHSRIVRSLEPSLTTTTSRFGYEMKRRAHAFGDASCFLVVRPAPTTLMRGVSSGAKEPPSLKRRMPKT